MAKALGLNPAKLGKIANHKQEPWKAPLPLFIAECYEKRFGARTRRPQELLPPSAAAGGTPCRSP